MGVLEYMSFELSWDLSLPRFKASAIDKNYYQKIIHKPFKSHS